MPSHDSSHPADVGGAAAEPDADDPYNKYDKYLADSYLDTERVRGRSLLSEQEQKAERKLLRRGRLTDRERDRLAAGREDKLHEPTLPPGADRWSTWGDGELGPEPRPDWLVISDGAVDSRLGVVKTGKEADVHLVERWVPSEDSYGFGEDADTDQDQDVNAAPSASALASCLLAEKIYRGNDHRNFHRDAGYLDGRRTRESRLDRAVSNRTRFGLKVIAEQWAVAEFAALGTLWAAGAPVPYPVQRVGTELLIEFIGDPDGAAAPRLAALRPDLDELADLWGQLRAGLGYVARAGFTHGDLSAYNILVHHGRLVLIDLPQIVDLAANPHSGEYLSRDIANVTSWFAARGLPDADRRGAELLDDLRYEARLS
ncbi:MAG TPA: RIO1 family regulatory kinase/ATPase [Actinospica sp.]|nr:RIO1 family regulatory kinase/ATPase [Actinospica sp.]HWG25518.1 RIO1 family regulatory kinase/ATPase [Actinospica sp.]